MAYGYMTAMDRRLLIRFDLQKIPEFPSPSAGSPVNPSVQLGS